MGNNVVARMDFDNLGVNERIKLWFDSMSPVESVRCDLSETRKFDPKGTTNV